MFHSDWFPYFFYYLIDKNQVLIALLAATPTDSTDIKYGLFFVSLLLKPVFISLYPIP